MGRLKEQQIAFDEANRAATRLGDLAREGIPVFCWCNRCGHNADLPLEILLAKAGPATPVPEIGAMLRCSSCGSKDVATRPAWPSLGRVTRHD